MATIEVKDLYFGYKDEKVIDGVSFEIEKGNLVSLIGPNGSGKSTMIKLLNNLYTPWEGKIFVEGKEINSFRKKELARKIALVPQNSSINYDFTVEEIVRMGRYPHKKRFQREDEEDHEIVEKAMKDTNTYELRDKAVTEISGGELQRVIIAKALAQKPSIILLDEPTSHLDLNHQIEILNLLRKLNKEKNTTIIVAIHDINLATMYSDEIFMLSGGKIVDRGSPEKVITKRNIEFVYNLPVAVHRNKYTNSLSITPLNV
ncbi:MAG: ABC transporter ATP-binding protein [Tissierellaceae bacterium]|nr:ABC transporter ATP-binding protein [Tissierellaceae bacterium]